MGLSSPLPDSEYFGSTLTRQAVAYRVILALAHQIVMLSLANYTFNEIRA